MKQYLLSMVQPSNDEAIPPPEVLDPIMVEVGKIRDELQAQGSWVFGNGLEGTSSSRTIRVGDGGTIVSDGPFAEAKEHLGGVTIIQVDGLDEALEWGRRYAEATTLPIEVRPFQGEIPG